MRFTRPIKLSIVVVSETLTQNSDSVRQRKFRERRRKERYDVGGKRAMEGLFGYSVRHAMGRLTAFSILLSRSHRVGLPSFQMFSNSRHDHDGVALTISRHDRSKDLDYDRP
ncbi:hypothetical protein BHM03_00014491 [Ensete ventricosum]|nr:hypothetical protein BHM03_00014491 [Ensete ventricosum]